MKHGYCRVGAIAVADNNLSELNVAVILPR
jgi:hypothetical protein